MIDLYHDLKFKTLADPADISDTTTWLGYVDTQGFQGVLIGFQCGAAGGTADASNYVTPTLYEADSTPAAAASYSAVAAGDIIGSYAAVASAATDSVTQVVGYKGSKRYVALKSVGTGTTISALTVSAFVAAGAADHEPSTGVTLTTGTVS